MRKSWVMGAYILDLQAHADKRSADECADDLAKVLERHGYAVTVYAAQPCAYEDDEPARWQEPHGVA